MSCKICEFEEHQPRKCSYCGSVVCMKHRLPEKHDCVPQSQLRVPGITQQTSNKSTIRQRARRQWERERSNIEQAPSTFESRTEKITKEIEKKASSPETRLDGSLGESPIDEQLEDIGLVDKQKEGEAEPRSGIELSIYEIGLALIILASIAFIVLH